MSRGTINKDGILDNEFGKDNVELSREVAAERNEYLEMDNLNRKKNKIKKTGKK